MAKPTNYASYASPYSIYNGRQQAPYLPSGKASTVMRCGPLSCFASSAPPSPPPIPFPIISGLVGRWNVNSANNQVDGGTITSIADLSGNNGPFGGGTANLLFTAGRWDTDLGLSGQSVIQTPLNGYMFAASAPLIAAFAGVHHPFTVIDVYQDLNAGGSTLWSAETTYPYVQSLRKDNAQTLQLQNQNGSPTFSFANTETQGPVIKAVTRNATTASAYINGVPDAANPLNTADANNYQVTKFSWGEQDGNHSAFMLHKERLVYDRELTPPELASITQYLAQQHGLDWCQAIGSGLGTTGNDVIVIPILGSSNAAGQGTTLYPRQSSDVWTLDWDFFTRTVPNGQPISTVQPAVSVPNITRPLNSNIADAWSALADTLKADPQFAGKTLLFVPLGIGLYSSAQCAQGIATNPKNITEYYGNAWYKIKYALRGKNAKIGGVVIYQGEVNATISLAASTTGLTADWTAILAALDSDFAGKFLKSKHHFAIVPPPTVPGTIDPTWWAAMRATWNTLGGSIATLQVIPGTDGPWTNVGTNLHIDTGTASPPTGLRGDGINVGNAMIAAV